MFSLSGTGWVQCGFKMLWGPGMFCDRGERARLAVPPSIRTIFTRWHMVNCSSSDIQSFGVIFPEFRVAPVAVWPTLDRTMHCLHDFFGVKCFSLFSATNFFQNFRHDFSRFLHIWPIFRVGENGKNVKNLDHEEPDLRSEFRAWERFIEALSGKKGFLLMTFMKKIFDHLSIDMVKKIVNRPKRGRWTKKSGDLKE